MNEYYPFKNTPLPYPYDSLEPYIDTKTMELHHDKHLQKYIDSLNDALMDYPEYQKLSLNQLIVGADRLPPSIRTAVKNNAGGVYNHRFYFDGMANCEIKNPIGKLSNEIDNTYDNFKREFRKAALSVFGSGYAWLVVDKNGRLKIVTTPNQNTPLDLGLCPILNIDVWEHAYYLKNYNMRIDYINNWFNVVNWRVAEERFNACNSNIRLKSR